jgi:hypothetical protein
VDNTLTLCGIAFPAKASHKRWYEVLDCLRPRAESEQNAQGPRPPICADHLESFPFANLLVRSLRQADAFNGEAVASKQPLFLGEKLAGGRGGKIGEDEEYDNGSHNGRKTFEDLELSAGTFISVRGVTHK